MDGVARPDVQYVHPAGVAAHHDAGRPLLSTAEGGFVAVDDPLVALWRGAAGHSLAELAEHPLHVDLTGLVPAALACLAEAGLLSRIPAAPPPSPSPRTPPPHSVIAIIIVSVPGELVWLEELVRALNGQHHPVEVLVVDNAVGTDMMAWLAERRLSAKVHSLSVRTNFASALNAGVAAAPPSDYVFLLNADVKPHAYCVGNLVARAAETPRCAAVAPKLYLWRTPAFLNGLGNRVPGWGFGTDNGMGQLDLGQLDDWTEIPSGCLAAVLMSRAALADVGPFDAGYPLYYEDTDWSFRARIRGYRIAAAPDAHALHAYGATWTSGEATSLSPMKLRNAIIGQFRFAAKIPSPGRSALLGLHALNDSWINVSGAVRTRDRAALGAYARAAGRIAWTLPSVLLERRRIQSRRVTRDADLFAHADDLTPSMTWRNLPELTMPNVRDYYAPLIAARRTRPLPEFADSGARS
jgi:GT2 family glycosyltransferase